MRRSLSVILMLAHRRRRWANIKTTLDGRLVFIGLGMTGVVMDLMTS